MIRNSSLRLMGILLLSIVHSCLTASGSNLYQKAQVQITKNVAKAIYVKAIEPANCMAYPTPINQIWNIAQTQTEPVSIQLKFQYGCWTPASITFEVVQMDGDQQYTKLGTFKVSYNENSKSTPYSVENNTNKSVTVTVSDAD